MAGLLKITRLARPLLFKQTQLLAVLPRTYAYWNKDWKPGEWPTTPEERAAAAKKYGLRPEDYEPYPDESYYGDYPKLPDIGGDSKSEFAVWDIPEIKRNYGEPLPVHADALTGDRADPTQVYRYSWRLMYTIFFGVFGALAAFYYIVEDYKIHHPVMPKQWPKEGVTHYTFEKVD